MAFWLIALLLIYGGWQFLRALRIGFRRQAVSPTPKETSMANLDEDLFNYDVPLSEKESQSSLTVAVYSHTLPGIATSEKTKETPLDSFAIELELQRLRLELNTLREMADAQQKDIEYLYTKVESSTAVQIETRIPFAMPEQDMSMEYDEALALARRGIMADVIASRCGITRAEADLVASLAARGQRQQAAGEVL
jgi:hypothetical protein